MNNEFSDEISVLQSIYQDECTIQESINNINQLPQHIQLQYNQQNNQDNSNNLPIHVLDITVYSKHTLCTIYIRYYTPNTYPYSQLYYTLYYNDQHDNITDLVDDSNTSQLLNIDIEHIKQSIQVIQDEYVDQVRIYNITEYVKQHINDNINTTTIQQHDVADNNDAEFSTEHMNESSNVHQQTQQQRQQQSTTEYTIYTGDPITEKHSTFQSHVCTVYSIDDVNNVLSQLYANNKIARATHNMYAYSITMNDNTQYIHSNDDGETGSGRILYELLVQCKCVNTLVVVSRWYGGILLGSQRFALIKEAANKTLRQYGFVK